MHASPDAWPDKKRAFFGKYPGVPVMTIASRRPVDVETDLAEGERLEMELALDRYADQDAPYPCWLASDDHDDDEEYYCPDCAAKAVASRPGFRVVSDGCASEHDGCCHCSDCGKLLAYVLTDYGVKAELEHFREHPPTAPLDKEVAAHIARIIAGASDNAAAIALAQAALALKPGDQA